MKGFGNQNKSKKKKSRQQEKIDLKKELNELIEAGLTLSSASKYLSKKNGLKKRYIYSEFRIYFFIIYKFIIDFYLKFYEKNNSI